MVDNPRMQRILAACAFSFFVVAAVLFWEGYKLSRGLQGPAEKTRILIFLVAGMLSVVMGVIGTRARHKRLRDEEDRE